MNKVVLFFFPNALVGGAENVMLLYSRELINKNFTVHHFTFSNLSLYEVDSNLNRKFIKCSIRLDSYDFVFSSIFKCNILSILMKKWNLLDTEILVLRESTIIDLRFNGVKWLIIRSLIRWTNSNSYYRIFQTELMQKRFYRSVGVNRVSRHAVIPNPLDRKKITGGIKNDVGLELTTPYILAVGRLIREKGFSQLIHAYKIHADKLPKLIIIGEGSLRSLLLDEIKHLSLEDKVSLVGMKKNPYPYMKQASLCVVSSHLEGFPNVLLEMLACNPRVIVNRFPGLPESDAYITSDINDPLTFSNDMLTTIGSDHNKKNIEDFLENYKVKSVMNNFYQFIDL